MSKDIEKVLDFFTINNIENPYNPDFPLLFKISYDEGYHEIFDRCTKVLYSCIEVYESVVLRDNQIYQINTCYDCLNEYEHKCEKNGSTWGHIKIFLENFPGVYRF